MNSLGLRWLKGNQRNINYDIKGVSLANLLDLTTNMNITLFLNPGGMSERTYKQEEHEYSTLCTRIYF